MNKTIIIAHRGVSEFAPENTLPALEIALDLNCLGMEFDVHLTKDNVPVIIHDETIDRTSTGEGRVKDFTLLELKSFDFGIKFNTKFEGAKIPTLEEFLQMAKTKKYTGVINVEIKNDVEHYPHIEEKVLALLDSYGFSKQALISSFNHQSISRVREISSEMKVALLYDENAPTLPRGLNDTNISSFLDGLKKVNAYSANIHFSDFSTELLNILQKEGIKLFCYTINSEQDLRKYIDHGIHGIFTNNPELGQQILKTREG